MRLYNGTCPTCESHGVVFGAQEYRTSLEGNGQRKTSYGEWTGSDESDESNDIGKGNAPWTSYVGKINFINNNFINYS